MRACLHAGLVFGLSMVVACDARPFWQRYSEPNGANCMAAATGCATGEVCNTATEACEPALELLSAAPDLVSGAGGDRIELHGRNFRPDMTVRIGQAPGAVATSLDFVDATRLSLTVPANPGSSWSVPISAELLGQSVTRGGLLSYFAQTISFSGTRIESVPNEQEVAVGDFNNDMRLDVLLVTNSSPDARISTLIGKGDGTFNVGPTLLFTNRSLKPMMLQDINRDNYPDLLVGSTNGLEVLINNKTGGFATPTTVTTDSGSAMPEVRSIAVGDWNNDGLPDVAAANTVGDSFTILLNNGAGGFAAPMPIETGTGPEVVLSGDWNKDQRPDLITLSTSVPLQVRLGDNQANFPVSSTPSATGCDATQAFAADLNNDTSSDVIILCRNNTIRVLLGNSNSQDNDARSPPYRDRF